MTILIIYSITVVVFYLLVRLGRLTNKLINLEINYMILQQKQLIINEHIKYMSKGNVRKYYLNEVLAQAIENEEFEKAEELKNLINKINENI